MKAFLDGIRTPKPGGSFTKQFLITVAILAFGFALGVLQKWMDESAGSVFPPILLQLDLGNFFGRLGIWIVLGTALSVYAPSPLRASLHTAGFFLSMVAGYYLYCNYGLGFLPKTYMMMWIIAACLSWFPAYAAWYAKGNGFVAILLSSGILGVLLAQAVSLTQGVYIYHSLEVFAWLLGVLLLYRKPKELALELGLSLLVAFLYQCIFPYWG